jgi:hypothetical protein
LGIPDASENLKACGAVRVTERHELAEQASLRVRHTQEFAQQSFTVSLGVVLMPTDDGRDVVFNPFIWQGDAELSRAALRAEDSRAREAVGALIEEVAARPGLPQVHVTSTSPAWVDSAVSQGLVQRTVVETSKKGEQAFLFTPHLARDPFGVSSGDPSGHVRLLVGADDLRDDLREPSASRSREIRRGHDCLRRGGRR